MGGTQERVQVVRSTRTASRLTTGGRSIDPGRALREVSDDAGITANARIPAKRLTEIINGKRSISADTALGLARYFRTSERMWMNLQVRYGLEMAEDALGSKIEAEVQPVIN
jgi:addiction module HigA family antidote